MILISRSIAFLSFAVEPCMFTVEIRVIFPVSSRAELYVVISYTCNVKMHPGMMHINDFIIMLWSKPLVIKLRGQTSNSDKRIEYSLLDIAWMFGVYTIWTTTYNNFTMKSVKKNIKKTNLTFLEITNTSYE